MPLGVLLRQLEDSMSGLQRQAREGQADLRLQLRLLAETVPQWIAVEAPNPKKKAKVVRILPANAQATRRALQERAKAANDL